MIQEALKAVFSWGETFEMLLLWSEDRKPEDATRLQFKIKKNPDVKESTIRPGRGWGKDI